jgi:aspartyl aminopeptidase
MSDAHSAAIFRSLCEGAGSPYQYFVNHSDVAGGSTLGNILTSQIDIEGVDVGNALWAMHSVRESASVEDHCNMIKVMKYFFSC